MSAINPTFVIIQLVGLCGAVCSVSSFQSNRRRLILVMQIISCLIWGFHYSLLTLVLGQATGWTGIILNIVCAARSVVFYFNDRRWAKSAAWLYGFIAATVLLTVFTSPPIMSVVRGGALTYDAAVSVLPAVGMVLTSIAFWSKDTRITRAFTLANSPCWMVYNFYSG
ncbi:MAG: YgjV family protein, partial [Eubacteriales bacterium]